MEKITKKKKKSKRLKRRIGLIAIGGLSLVLTVCLSVGATLAWFAGSTWASKDLYMGGPVYVEMAGRGAASGATSGNGTATANWKGGDGHLDIVASGRTQGTSKTMKDGETPVTDTSNILLPGQKLLIYSQARVFSTAYYDNLDDGDYANQSSGANTNNSNFTYTDGTGRVRTATTSVLRAKFSIDIEFDPYMGFNNFTDVTYASNYPEISGAYTGEYGVKKGDGSYEVYGTDSTTSWTAAAGAATLGTANGRRDAVANAVPTTGEPATEVKTGIIVEGTTKQVALKPWAVGATATDPTTITADEMWAIWQGKTTSIYEWKYVSADDYVDSTTTKKMGAPFNGQWNSSGNPSANQKTSGEGVTPVTYGTGNGFYGVWVMKDTSTAQESQAFYKARTNAYLNSYKEHYRDDYTRELVLTVTKSLNTLEKSLNDSFVRLVNESSDNILSGNVEGFTIDTDTGNITHATAKNVLNEDITSVPATWLYVDPSIGNDTNAGDSATSVGGWWYLVESDGVATVSSGQNQVKTVSDKITYKDGETTKDLTSVTGTIPADAKNSHQAGTSFTRYSETNTSGMQDTNKEILKAKLFEINPNYATEELNAADGVTKIVSVAFPFVNGDFELPGQALTNIFANAKITFKISFQALQAFFPFTPSIDGIASGTPLTGTAKALNIENAIPIYNEAFDYLTSL